MELNLIEGGITVAYTVDPLPNEDRKGVGGLRCRLVLIEMMLRIKSD